MCIRDSCQEENPVLKQFFKIQQPYKIKILRNTVIIRKGIDDGHDSREQDNGHADEQLSLIHI